MLISIVFVMVDTFLSLNENKKDRVIPVKGTCCVRSVGNRDDLIFGEKIHVGHVECPTVGPCVGVNLIFPYGKPRRACSPLRIL